MLGIGLVCLAIQALVLDPFLQPIIFLVVSVESVLAAHELQIQVHDDGIGFDSGARQSSPDPNSVTGGAANGFGLLSIRERARLSGGTLQIKSAPGAGTRIAIIILIKHHS